MRPSLLSLWPSGRLHKLAPYPLGRFPKLLLHFFCPTFELDNCAGDSPATAELDFASSAEVKVEVACAPRHWVRFVPPTSSAMTPAVTALVTDTVERGLACSVCFTHASAQVVSSLTPSILASLIRSH
jgi:hypothetical protein